MDTLYEHVTISHTPRDVNALQNVEHMAAGWNTQIAVKLTRAVGTMECAYLFIALAAVGFPGLHAAAPAYVQWVSQTMIQLVMLPILAVGQNVLSRKQELQAGEQFSTTQKIYLDSEQMRNHMDAQDQKLLALEAKLDAGFSQQQKGSVPSGNETGLPVPPVSPDPGADPQHE